jgi:hypothetical protein
MTAAGVGWLMWLLLGGGFAAAATAIPLAIVLMILLEAVYPPAAVHPPVVATALAFAIRVDPTANIVLFAIAVGITALLVALKRAVSWLIRSNSRLPSKAIPYVTAKGTSNRARVANCPPRRGFGQTGCLATHSWRYRSIVDFSRMASQNGTNPGDSPR